MRKGKGKLLAGLFALGIFALPSFAGATGSTAGDNNSTAGLVPPRGRLATEGILGTATAYPEGHGTITVPRGAEHTSQAANAAILSTPTTPKPSAPIHKFRLLWAAVPNAVRYQFVVTKGDDDDAPIVYTYSYIFNNGFELPVKDPAWVDGTYFWKARPLDYDGKPIGPFTMPKSLMTGERNPSGPLPTSEYANEDAPLYPTFSWVAYPSAEEYEVSVWKRGATGSGNDLLHLVYTRGLTAYDTAGFTTPGHYFWRVRALDSNKQPISAWSPDSDFEVRKGAAVVAAFGDSITHGGGAITYGPDRRIYDWETYVSFPVKNLGFSGDTAEAMDARFNRDVLPFHPKILVISGGVNDYRQGDDAGETIAALASIRDKCRAHGIIPVFMTQTSLNPYKISKSRLVSMPPDDWQTRQEAINEWIMSQPYAIDVTSTLSDGSGNMEANYTTDGLHPDAQAKRYMGEAVNHYLLAHFANIIQGETANQNQGVRAQG